VWGPEGAGWRAWFAGNVIDGLCEILDEHLAAERRGYLFPHGIRAREGGSPAAIGCVPWLTDDDVIDRLLQLSACCVVVDKAGLLDARLVDHDRSFPNVLPGLQMTTPAADGAPTLLGPSSPMPEHEVGPLRVLGWGKDAGKGFKPLLHAKLLVLGELGFVTYIPDDAPEFEEFRFTPQSVWWGSANWTRGSRSHLEVGCWSDDHDLVREATSFLDDVIAFSEPVGSTCAGPEPNLVSVDFDDEAMWEAARDQWADHLADEEGWPYGP
jgi:hypothetical protein